MKMFIMTSTSYASRSAPLLALVLVLLLVVVASLPSGFIVVPARASFFLAHDRRSVRVHGRLSAASTSNPTFSSSSSTDNDILPLIETRDRLVDLSRTLSSRSRAGKVFISSPADALKFRDEFVRFESEVASLSKSSTCDKAMLLGDWTLIATANLPPRFASGGKRKDDDKDTELTKELNPFQKAIQRTIEVTQRIRSIDGSGKIDRVDNVIEFTPLTSLDDILPEDSPLTKFDNLLDLVNPLKVKKAKVVLVHKAEVESVHPVLRTRIAWTSTIINIAGSSQYLDPNGDDVFGLNNVLGEFLNVGTFDTPYVDDTVRLSRTSGPVSDQLRVFVREGASPQSSSNGDVEAGGAVVVEAVEADDETTSATVVTSTMEVEAEVASGGGVEEEVVSVGNDGTVLDTAATTAQFDDDTSSPPPKKQMGRPNMLSPVQDIAENEGDEEDPFGLTLPEADNDNEE